jgi:hypothetical protein
VLGNEACFRRLAHYLPLPPDEMEVRIPRAIVANGGHESSYMGNKWGKDLKHEVEHVMKHNKHTLPDFDFWGYAPEDYRLSRDCESLPWMDLMRKKKGPLPGDNDTKLINAHHVLEPIRLPQNVTEGVMNSSDIVGNEKLGQTEDQSIDVSSMKATPDHTVDQQGVNIDEEEEETNGDN